MEAPLLGMSPEAFVAVFPFHIVFGRDLVIRQVGPSLRRVCPAVAPGAAASSCVRIKRPLIGLDFEAIKAHPRAVFVLEAGPNQVSLRGQMIADEAADHLFFLGSPQVTSLAMISSLGLELDDFAVHDATPDLLFLLQSKNTTLGDAKKLTAELTDQKAELRNANKRLAAQFAVTRVLIEAPSIDAAMTSVLAALGEGLDGSMGAWWEVEERAQALRCAEVWRPSARKFGRFEAEIRGLTVTRGSGLAGQAWSLGRPVWASEVSGGCPLLSFAAAYGLPDAFAFPIVVDRTVLGVIGFFYEKKSPPEAEHRPLLIDTGVKIGQFAERRRADEALRESEERYALAAMGAKDGLWDWKLKTGHVYYSPRWKAMVGASEGAVSSSLDEWLRRVHPDDKERLEAELAAHLDGQTEHFELEHRMMHDGGGSLWVLVRGIAVRDEEGNAVRMAGTQTDVTERKLAEIELMAAREDLAQKLALVERQERAIRELSTPIIRIWEGVLALPVIGSLDEARAAQLTERLLGELSRTRARVAVLDLTGAAAMDRTTAGHLVRVMRASKLLGSSCVIAGLSPALARSFAELGVEVSGFVFFADVKSALAWVFQGRGGRAAV
jgi:PAS domain S-box-containing protein